MGWGKGKSHYEENLVSKHAQTHKKETLPVATFYQLASSTQLVFMEMDRPYSYREKDHASKQFSVKRKNDGRHRLQSFFTDAVANTKQNVNSNGCHVNKPFWRDFYRITAPYYALLFSVRVSWFDSIYFQGNCVLFGHKEIQE